MSNTLLVDERIDKTERHTLELNGYEVILCPINNNLYSAVSAHPDMSIHVVSEKIIVASKNIYPILSDKLISMDYALHLCKNEPSLVYPNNIGLNAVSLKNYFIHNINHTDEILLEMIENKKIINIKQGYTKCSIAIVGDNSVITSDKGIEKALRKEGIDVLLLPGGDIELPGLKYGFIGGASGLIEKDIMAFYGDLNYYEYGYEVLEFLKKYKVKPLYLRKGRLYDRGSIIRL